MAYINYCQLLVTIWYGSGSPLAVSKETQYRECVSFSPLFSLFLSRLTVSLHFESFINCNYFALFSQSVKTENLKETHTGSNRSIEDTTLPKCFLYYSSVSSTLAHGTQNDTAYYKN